MAIAKKKTIDETPHFVLEEHSTRGRVIRRVLRCEKCHKEKPFAGMVPTIKHKCCNREYLWPRDEETTES